MKLRNFVTIDNTVRLSIGIKGSTDKALEAYMVRFKETHKLPKEFELSKSEFIERILRQFMLEDKAFIEAYPEGKKLGD